MVKLVGRLAVRLRVQQLVSTVMVRLVVWVVSKMVTCFGDSRFSVLLEEVRQEVHLLRVRFEGVAKDAST